MKVAITLLALVALGNSAPQSRKLFHEHYEDFLKIIVQESSVELKELDDQYMEFEEFKVGLNYMQSSGFRNLVHEMEDIPEFKAVIEFLEGHNIDISYFIDEINNAVDNLQKKRARNVASGKDLTAYVKDCIAVFPKEKLVALLEEKKAEDESFKVAMESFELEEWDEIYSALWKNEVFLKEVEILKENGIDVAVFLEEIRAVMGIFD